VVRSNGSVGGYRFGTKMKVELLKREGIVINESDMKIVDFNRVRFKLIR
jgi:alkylated DNA nucleotide flippase Atl1